MRINRDRDISRAGILYRIDPPRPAGDRRFVGRVVKVGVDPAKGKYALCQPCLPDFVEAEGAAVSLPEYGPLVPVAVLNGTPAVGDYLICTAASGGRWIAERSGRVGGGTGPRVSQTNCACPTPYTISMNSRNEACNFGMFRSCTLQYGPAPEVMASFGLRDKMWTSADMFVDPLTGSSFFYYFECFFNQYFLSRVFPNYNNSGPLKDGILYAWVFPANTAYGRNDCDSINPPQTWRMANGTAFPGSDVTCSIELTAASTQVVIQ